MLIQLQEILIQLQRQQLLRMKKQLKKNQQKKHLRKKPVLTLKTKMPTRDLKNKIVFGSHRWESRTFEYKCFFVFAVGNNPVGSAP